MGKDVIVACDFEFHSSAGCAGQIFLIGISAKLVHIARRISRIPQGDIGKSLPCQRKALKIPGFGRLPIIGLHQQILPDRQDHILVGRYQPDISAIHPCAIG